MKSQSLVSGLMLLLASMFAHAGEPYTLNPGDILRITVWNEEALHQDVMVLPDGTISFPLVGIIQVAETTPGEIRQQIKRKLSPVIPDPEINVTVQSVAGNNIFIIGKVKKPGQMQLIRPTDVMQALSLAGGLTTYAKGAEIKIIRRTADKQSIIRFDYTKLSEGKALNTNILLKSGDTIVVP